MSHTPGPWFGWRSERGMWTVQCPGGWIAELTIGRPNQEANVALIVAAPAMLAALRLIESVYRQNCVAPGEPSSVLEAVQAAIAQAEHRSAPTAAQKIHGFCAEPNPDEIDGKGMSGGSSR